MPPVEIVQVESASQLDDFIEYPYRLYAGDPCFVPPLLAERRAFFDFHKNPFYRSARVKLFLAVAGRAVAGRIATCVNFAHNEYHHEQTGFFGFFDCPDDYEIARQLLKVAMIELKREKMDKMRGPCNFSTNQECGFLVEGFDSPPVVMMTYNKPYLPRLAEKFGLKKAMDLLAFEFVKDQDAMPDRLAKMVDRVKQRSPVTLRTINMRDFDREVQRVRQVYNEAWQDNWGFVPMSEAEFNHMAADLKQVVDPAVVLIGEHGDRPVGFAMAVPDMNKALIHLNGHLLPIGVFKLLWHTKIRNKVDGIRVVIMGVVPEYQLHGLDALMYYELYHRGVQRGYRRAEFSWILETNDRMRRAAEFLGARLYKRYRLVEMPL